MNIKLKIGWLFWTCGKYTQVRNRTGGGVYDLEVSAEASNTELLLKAKELFFPDGK